MRMPRRAGRGSIGGRCGLCSPGDGGGCRAKAALQVHGVLPPDRVPSRRRRPAGLLVHGVLSAVSTSAGLPPWPPRWRASMVRGLLPRPATARDPRPGSIRRTGRAAASGPAACGSAGRPARAAAGRRNAPLRAAPARGGTRPACGVRGRGLWRTVAAVDGAACAQAGEALRGARAGAPPAMHAAAELAPDGRRTAGTAGAGACATAWREREVGVAAALFRRGGRGPGQAGVGREMGCAGDDAGGHGKS